MYSLVIIINLFNSLGQEKLEDYLNSFEYLAEIILVGFDFRQKEKEILTRIKLLTNALTANEESRVCKDRNTLFMERLLENNNLSNLESLQEHHSSKIVEEVNILLSKHFDTDPVNSHINPFKQYGN